MPHPPEYYIKLRNQYTPKKNNLIFLLESPPANGGYFYDCTDLEHQHLFNAMMAVFSIPAPTKEAGLREFCNRGYLLVDATYTSVNEIDDNLADQMILNNYDNLKQDLIKLGALENQTSIVLAKANICNLFMEELPKDGFNV